MGLQQKMRSPLLCHRKLRCYDTKIRFAAKEIKNETDFMERKRAAGLYAERVYGFF